METDEERKARVEKMVSTTLLRLALETEEERRAKRRNGFDLYLILKNILFSRNEFAHPVIGRAKRDPPNNLCQDFDIYIYYIGALNGPIKLVRTCGIYIDIPP